MLELKLLQDIHLPLQALDYWIRVKFARVSFHYGDDSPVRIE